MRCRVPESRFTSQAGDGCRAGAMHTTHVGDCADNPGDWETPISFWANRFIMHPCTRCRTGQPFSGGFLVFVSHHQGVADAAFPVRPRGQRKKKSCYLALDGGGDTQCSVVAGFPENGCVRMWRRLTVIIHNTTTAKDTAKHQHRVFIRANLAPVGRCFIHSFRFIIA